MQTFETIIHTNVDIKNAPASVHAAGLEAIAKIAAEVKALGDNFDFDQNEILRDIAKLTSRAISGDVGQLFALLTILKAYREDSKWESGWHLENVIIYAEEGLTYHA